MTKTYDIEETLPLSVPVPEWHERVANVQMDVNHGKVTGGLMVCAMSTDDVFVEGTLVYRGNEYAIRYIHTNDQGQPKGYWYARNQAERDAKGDSNSQVYGVIPQDGTVDYELARAMGGAPKTYVRPLLEAVEATVQRYLRDEAAHAEGARRASLTQNVNRAADAYNRLAKGAAEALVKYQAELAIMEAYG
jgi:hypothetical protein